MAAAYQKIREKSSLPSICGRICSAPCEIACILSAEESPIGIRALERYATDVGHSRSSSKIALPQGKRIAIVGSGPTGLIAATELAKKGYQVTIFESMDQPGGVLRYGIPEFRIPKKILDAEVQEIKALGVEIKTNFFVGQTATFEELFEKGFSVILLAMGAGIPQFMDLPGTHLGGVYYGEEFLMRVNLTKMNMFAQGRPNFFVGSKVVVVGSGNTALDCARAARRFGRDVTLMFRRSEGEMRVRSEELEFGKAEGIKIEPLVRPLQIIEGQEGFAGSLKCIRMDYADLEGKGEWQLTTVPDSEFTFDADTVIIAIGHHPNTVLSRRIPGLKLKNDETLDVDEQTGLTNIPKVFAAGNVVTNAGPVVDAMASGQKIAEKIADYLR